jgi:hypothetical protein
MFSQSVNASALGWIRSFKSPESNLTETQPKSSRTFMADAIEKAFAGRIAQDDLDRMIKAHEDYLNGIKGGRRLALQFMNLSG